MLKKKHYLYVLITAILFISIYLNSLCISNTVVHKAYGHSFTPNDYASFIASIDQFQTESKLVQTNLANNNLTLAQGHAGKAANLYFQNLMFEIAEKDQKVAEDLSKSVKSVLQNVSSSAFASSASEAVAKQQQVNQLVADIDTKVDEIITMTIRQQQGGSDFLSTFVGLVSSIFGEKKGENNPTIQPVRVAELVDSVLRSYGNAYSISFDMTNMSNMAMTATNSSMSMSGMSDDNNSVSGMDHMNMSPTMMNGNINNASKDDSLANVAEHQSAQALAAKALEIFNEELRSAAPDKDSTVFVSNIENGLIKLHDSIKDKASPMDVMMIAHTQIHPNLLDAFDLPLRPSA